MNKQILSYSESLGASVVENHLLLFVGDNYYPLGGWGDYAGAFSNIGSALEAAANRNCDWWQIVSLWGSTPSVVRSGTR